MTNVTAALSGNLYEAVFTNAAGNVTTQAAMLTVKGPPTITQQPQNQTVNARQGDFDGGGHRQPGGERAVGSQQQWRLVHPHQRGDERHANAVERHSGPERQPVQGGLHQRRRQSHHPGGDADRANAASVHREIAASDGRGRQRVQLSVQGERDADADVLAVQRTAWLIINPTTGVVSGTSTLAKTYTAIKVTATNSAGSVSTTFNLTVEAGTATSFTVTGPTRSTVDAKTAFTVTSYDEYGNVATNFSSSVSLTSGAGALATDVTLALNEGKGTILLTFLETGTFSLTAAGSYKPTSAKITGVLTDIVATKA